MRMCPSLENIPTSFSRRFVLTVLAIALGCGGGGNDSGGTTAPPPPAGGGFVIAASGASLSIARSATGSLSISITRTGGFTGAVSLTATGLPTGATVGFSPSQVDATTVLSTMTVTVGAASPAGTTTFTVQATSPGQTTRTLDVQLTITTPPAQTGPFTMSISATSFLVLPNNHVAASPIITLTRNAGFTGAVSFSVTGLPPTLFIGFTPSSTSGNTTTVIPLGLGAPNGVYTATIRGSSSQGDQTVTLQVHVQSATTGNIKWKWCSGSLPRYFVAVRDGTGPWTRIMPANDSTYSFSLSSGTGSLAEVTVDSGGYRTTVYNFTTQEMTARGTAQCALVKNVSTRTANGSFGGVTGFRTSEVGMGWWFGSANGNGTFSLLNLPAGPLDLIAVRNGDITVPSQIPVDRMIIRRGINPASGSTMPVLDFNGTESFAPVSVTWGFGNRNGESFSISQTFTTAGGSTGIFTSIPGVDAPDSARTIYSVPQAQTIAGDLHQVVATVATVGPVPGGPTRATRQIVAYARTLGSRNLSFGPALPAPAVSPIATAPLGRLRAQGTLPTEYNSGVTFDVTQTSTARFYTIHATRGFLGAGNAYDLQMPDLTGAIGWDTQFAIRAGIATNWWVSGGGPTLDWFDARYLFNSTRSQWTGALTGITAPADGATYYFARALGTSVP